MTRKDVNAINEDVVKAQWKKQTEAHQRLWNAISQIGARLGITFDEDGRPVEAGGQDLILNTGLSSADMDELKMLLMEAIQAMDVRVTIGADFFDRMDKETYDYVTEKWRKWFEDFMAGQKPVGTQGPGGTGSGVKPRKQSAIRRFFSRLWEDCVSRFWKFFAYSLAIGFAIATATEWYYNRTLVSTAQEYTVVRTLLKSDPACRRQIEQVDTLMRLHGVKEMHDYLQNRK